MLVAAEPVPLKRVVELARSHSTTAAAADAMEQRAFASHRELRNQYLPVFVLGSGTYNAIVGAYPPTV